ncbi:Plant transposon protein [Fragilaria crotonensis]|nr:Plant transposon protein [Fragilaria crotonensis]
MSAWWEDYIDDPQPGNQHWAKEFRQNFRLPYASYVMLLDMISSEASDGLFDRWIKAYERTNKYKNKGFANRIASLGFAYLGRGWTFDDMKDVTYISRDVHRLFFLRQAHLGAKSKSTMRTYNLTCNHRRQILHTTSGHPGRWNDKTLIRFDTFMSELRDGGLDDKMDFELRTRQGMTSDEEGDDRILRLKGAYVIVDNGYLEWSTTVPPVKDSQPVGAEVFSG